MGNEEGVSPQESGMNHHPELVPGVMEGACVSVLKDFFKSRR